MIAERGGQRQLIVQAQLPASKDREAYEVWLYNSTGRRPLARRPGHRPAGHLPGRRPAAGELRALPLHRRLAREGRPGARPLRHLGPARADRPDPGAAAEHGHGQGQGDQQAPAAAGARSGARRTTLRRQQLPRVHDPAGIDPLLHGRAARPAPARPPRAPSTARDRRPTAWWWVIVPPFADDRVAGGGLGRPPLLELRAGLLAGDEREVQGRARRVEVRDVAHHRRGVPRAVSDSLSAAPTAS